MRIVVGFAPSPEAHAALARAIEEARLRGASLLVINASRGDRYTDPSFASEQDLAGVYRELDLSDVEHEVTQTVRGKDPAEEILEAAAAPEVGLIVIGLRHRTVAGKFLLGSTAQRILLDAPCAVLAVKA